MILGAYESKESWIYRILLLGFPMREGLSYSLRHPSGGTFPDLPSPLGEGGAAAPVEGKVNTKEADEEGYWR